jgi:hypothetical protein
VSLDAALLHLGAQEDVAMIQPRRLVGALVAAVMSATAMVKDSVANGIAIGALAGGTAAFAFVKIAEARCGPGCEGPDGPLALQAFLGGAAIGGATGLVIDLVRKPGPASPTLNVGPLLSPRKKGVAVRVRR